MSLPSLLLAFVVESGKLSHYLTDAMSRRDRCWDKNLMALEFDRR